MGIKVLAKGLHQAEFFSVPYAGDLESRYRLWNHAGNVCENGHFDFSISKDEQGNIYVDLNPADDDGFEYKVDPSKKLFVASDDKWLPANWSNERGVKNSKNGKEVAHFSDTSFVFCLEQAAKAAGLYVIPEDCRRADNENDRVACVSALTGSRLGYSHVGFFLSAYRMALPPG